MRSTLLEMLRYKRPMGSITERKFRNRWITTLPGAFTDQWGNMHVSVPRPDGSASRVLWSAHTDTVHTNDGKQDVEVAVVKGIPWAQLPLRSTSNCLGADDTVGCYLMREMVIARVPGWYTFHYGEERGGVGARQLAAGYADWLTASFDCAIALDRADCGDVITHQGIRTASKAFAESLGAALGVASGDTLHYTPCRGVYTDTREYAGAIPECTNLSVGYQAQHRFAERVNLSHVDRLLDALLALDVSALVIERDPKAVETYDWPAARHFDEWDWSAWEERHATLVASTAASSTALTVANGGTHRAQWMIGDRASAVVSDARCASILAEADRRPDPGNHPRTPRLTTANAAPGMALTYDGPVWMHARPGSRCWIMMLGERSVYVTWDRTDPRVGSQRDGGYPYWHFVVSDDPGLAAADADEDNDPTLAGADAATDDANPFFVRVDVP